MPASLSIPPLPPRTLTQRPLFPSERLGPTRLGKPDASERIDPGRTKRSRLKGRGGFIRSGRDAADQNRPQRGPGGRTGTAGPLEPPPGRRLTLLPFDHRRATAGTSAGRRSKWSNPTSKRNARPRNRIRRNPSTCRSTSPAPPRFKHRKRAPPSTPPPAARSPACQPRRSRLQYNPSAPW